MLFFSLLLPLVSICFSDSDSKLCIKDRDPFYLSNISSKKRVRYFKNDPKLLGVMFCDKKNSAMVSFGDRVVTVKPGYVVDGYRIINIEGNSVTALTPEQEEVKWFI